MKGDKNTDIGVVWGLEVIPGMQTSLKGFRINSEFSSYKHVIGNWYEYSCNIAGLSLESMQKTVDQAAVVLMCFSQKYKESPRCRAG